MSQQPHPFEVALRQMSAKIGAIDNYIKGLPTTDSVARLSGQVSVLQNLLGDAAASGGGHRGGGSGDLMGSKAFARAWGGAGYVSLDAIQGRFIPYDEFVEIPIADGVATQQQGVLKVSIEGPFVATHRYAVYQSRVKYKVAFQNGTSATFNGRTYGRFRGIASNVDIMDAVHAFEQISQYQPSYTGAVVTGAGNIIPVPNPVGISVGSNASVPNMLPNFPGTGRPILVSPLSMSSGRSMQFDGTIAITPQGAQFQRQNIPIPSSLWSEGFNKPFRLPCYDVLEPGEEVLVSVTPSHTNNPPFGNINNLVYKKDDFTYTPATGAVNNNPLPTGPFPFLAGQFDGHEGINDETLNGDTSTTVDRVTRINDAVIIIGYVGFRIIAPPGAPIG